MDIEQIGPRLLDHSRKVVGPCVRVSIHIAGPLYLELDDIDRLVDSSSVGCRLQATGWERQRHLDTSCAQSAISFAMTDVSTAVVHAEHAHGVIFSVTRVPQPAIPAWRAGSK